MKKTVHSDFYKKYAFWLSRWKSFEKYIRKNYSIIEKEVSKTVIFKSWNKIRALLCWTSGEITSRYFSSMILWYNKQSTIIILDQWPDQVNQSRFFLEKELPNAQIEYCICDASNTWFQEESIHFIETDFMFEYFNDSALNELISEWQRILHEDGVITFRAFLYEWWFSWVLNWCINIWIYFFLWSKTFLHNKKHFEGMLTKFWFSYEVTGYEFKPVGYRYKLQKKNLNNM